MSKNRETRFYLDTNVIALQPGNARITVDYKDRQETISIRFGEIQGGIVQGVIRDADRNLLEEETVRLEGDQKNATDTDPNGHFFSTTYGRSK